MVAPVRAWEFKSPPAHKENHEFLDCIHNTVQSPCCYNIDVVKRNPRVRVNCKHCGNQFTAKPSHVSRGFGKFCSRTCSSLSQRTGKQVACHVCGSVVYRIPKDLSQSKSGKFFCNKHCQTVWRNQLYIGEKHANWIHGRAAYRSVLSRAKMQRICVLCKTSDARVLAVHHIDRDRANNTLKNLAWLCHNCHFLVHHYDVGQDLGLS